MSRGKDWEEDTAANTWLCRARLTGLLLTELRLSAMSLVVPFLFLEERS